MRLDHVLDSLNLDIEKGTILSILDQALWTKKSEAQVLRFVKRNVSGQIERDG